MVQDFRGLVLEDKPRFGRLEVRNFQVRSCIKGKIYPFLIFYVLRTIGSVQGSVILGGLEVRNSVSEDKPRFGRLKVQFS